MCKINLFFVKPEILVQLVDKFLAAFWKDYACRLSTGQKCDFLDF
jgi:hypothetical protein